MSMRQHVACVLVEVRIFELWSYLDGLAVGVLDREAGLAQSLLELLGFKLKLESLSDIQSYSVVTAQIVQTISPCSCISSILLLSALKLR